MARTYYLSILRMTDSTSGSGTKIKYFSDCGGATVQQTNFCSNIQLGTPVSFTAELESEDCGLTGGERPAEVPISSVGIEESLVISVSSNCECDCAGSSPGLSAACSGHGSLDCGQCICEVGFYGETCQCNGGNSSDDAEDRCRAPGSTAVCSGRGECSCGVCTCARSPYGQVSGLYCQCDDWTCPKDQAGNLCSGHGDCSCGACVCQDGWAGDACDCSTDTAPCVSPYDGEVCSGNGECDCGSCLCWSVESGSALYTGRFCEKNELAGPGACAEVRQCVECQQFGSAFPNFNCSACVIQSDKREVRRFK